MYAIRSYYGAATDAGQAAGAFRGEHPPFALHIDPARAGSAADPAVGALRGVAPDHERAEQAEEPEECSVGAEVAAPEVLIEGREDGQQGDDP